MIFNVFLSQLWSNPTTVEYYAKAVDFQREGYMFVTKVNTITVHLGKLPP